RPTMLGISSRYCSRSSPIVIAFAGIRSTRNRRDTGLCRAGTWRDPWLEPPSKRESIRRENDAPAESNRFAMGRRQASASNSNFRLLNRQSQPFFGPRAEQIVRDGLAVDQVRVRPDMLERLAYVCEEQGRKGKA